MVDIAKILQDILSWTGNNIPKVSGWVSNQISNITGEEPTQTTSKLLTFLIFALVIYFGSKATNKATKYAVIILSIIIIVSIGYSFFT